MSDYAYRILKALAANKGQVGIDTLMIILTEGIPDNELTEERRKLASTIINMKSGDTPSIKADFAMVNSGLGKYLDVRRWVQDADDQKDVDKVHLLSAGRIELAALKDIYEPTPPIQPITNNTVTIHGNNHGNVLQDTELRDLNTRIISPTTHISSNTGQTKQKISWVQWLVWIMSIIASGFAIYKIFIQK